MAIQKLIPWYLLGIFVPLLAIQLTAAAIDPTAFSQSNTIERDVCIIGGGSSGTYAAVRLLQNEKSVAIIETQNRLGGHVNTYADPTTGISFDYGVIYWDNIPVVLDYVGFFNISLAVLPLLAQGQVVSQYANFAIGNSVPASVLPNSTAQGEALFAYREIVGQYPFLDNGFDLPDPIPEDLLIPFGEFLQKYGLTDMAWLSFVVLEGVGNILSQPTLYIMKYLPQITVDSLLFGTSLSTANQDNQELYDAALAYIGNGTNAFLSSNVRQIERDTRGVKVVVSTPHGVKLIKASKLIVAIPPKLEKLENIGLDLDQQEINLFGQFNNSYYWDMLISNTGIPDNESFENINPESPGLVPPLPGLYGINPTRVPGLNSAYFSSPYYLSDDEVKSEVLATIARIQTANGISTDGTPEFVDFNNHAPFELTVPVEAIANGFYTDVNALQGQKNTWWTGAAWQSQDSSLIWNWTEYNLLPRILASLDV